MPNEPTEAQLTRLREALERERSEIEADIRLHLEQSESEHYAGLASQVGDLEDRALADLLVDDNLTLIHRDIEALREIHAALHRMAQGRYGECVRCGGAIPIARLEVYPSASRCRDCQAAYEREYGPPPAS